MLVELNKILRIEIMFLADIILAQFLFAATKMSHQWMCQSVDIQLPMF